MYEMPYQMANNMPVYFQTWHLLNSLFNRMQTKIIWLKVGKFFMRWEIFSLPSVQNNRQNHLSRFFYKFFECDFNITDI